MKPGSILLFVHPPFYKVGDKFFFDGQAQNGLRLWAANFDGVSVMAPLVEAPEGAPSDAKPLEPFLQAHPSVKPVMLPRRGSARFLSKDLWRERKRIRAEIDAAEYLIFGFSGYIGDWGTVASEIAANAGRKFGVFIDSVTESVARGARENSQRSALRRLRHKFDNALMEYIERRIVRNSSLALLHGQDTFDHYKTFAKNPRLVHNIHISKADRISSSALQERLDNRDKNKLLVSYAGRVEEIKAPAMWSDAVAWALENGVDVTAKWYGVGAQYDDEKERVANLGLDHAIQFMGFVAHREMLPELQKSDVFVFTHLTRESPRCLIEALSMGLPIVGFDSAYARHLVGDTHAGQFVPIGDTEALGKALKSIANDPARLRQMSIDARKVAEPLNDEDVFRERGDIIKEIL